MMVSPRQRSQRTTGERSRDAMLALLESRGIHDRCVIAAMTHVRREPFVPRNEVLHAYEDRPLLIGNGQTISQPYVQALMLQALELQGDERVLEIGTGSGYSAAVLSLISSHVYTVERDRTLARDAEQRLAALGFDGIDVICADGTFGWAEHAPYDAIVVAAGGPTVPRTLVEQLAIGGRIVIPIGARDAQYLTLVTKTSDHAFTVKDLGAVAFVPLVGTHGWPAIEPGESE